MVQGESEGEDNITAEQLVMGVSRLKGAARWELCVVCGKGCRSTDMHALTAEVKRLHQRVPHVQYVLGMSTPPRSARQSGRMGSMFSAGSSKETPFLAEALESFWRPLARWVFHLPWRFERRFCQSCGGCWKRVSCGKLSL